MNFQTWYITYGDAITTPAISETVMYIPNASPGSV